ncbi:hypothetical protein [Flavobacterium sp. J27]|uniref:hypothetical protein n=1 Tax=Flavobacterium sp. J27 TaxID=2060419 RepID=UPI001031879F|nr:hypothetical protein [Flavobacterium sp. J27]
MKYIKTIKTIGLVLCSFLGFAQELPQVTPPTPEASQMAKFVDMPVSLYNGTPNINIPIYTINAKGMQIPITISYHAKGIQVSEIASRVGLGWSLSAGGAITRQIRGAADESNDGYLQKNYIQDFTTNSNKRAQLWGDNANEIFDYYPDLFMFNFMGYSGKFVFDQITGEPVLQSFADLKIERVFGSGGYFDHFIITTPDGTKYYFGQTDHRDVTYTHSYRYFNNSTGQVDLGTAPASYPNNWVLTKIETITHNIITFDYELEEVIHYEVNEINNQDGGTVKFISYVRNRSFQNQLKQITFNDGKVVFNASTVARQDLYGGKALDNIEVYSDSITVARKVKFNYFYTTSTDDNLQTVYNYLKIEPQAYQSKKRLFLSSIDEVNVVDNSILRTTFEYNTLPLPNRFSNAKDNWGYYNGKENHFLEVFANADRKVDTIKSEAGILKKIMYPTGGYTQFEYEHNRVIPPTYFKNMLIRYNNPSTTKTVGLLKSSIFYDAATTSYYKDFEIKHTRTTTNFNVNFDTTNCQVNGPDQPGCMYDVDILNQNGGIIFHLVLGTNNNLIFYPGTYTLRVKPRGTHHPGEFVENEEFSVNGTWQEQNIPDSQELYAAGKRIKKITKGDATGILLEKEFFYTDENGLCSGKTFSLPAYFDIITTIGNYNVTGHNISGTSGPSSEFAGNNLGYSMVTEIQKGSGNIGKIVSTFTNYENGGEYYKFPYHLPVDNEWTRGLPKEVKYYKYENGSYSLLKKTINKYAFYKYDCAPIPDFTCLSNTPLDPDLPPSGLYPDYFISANRYSIPSYKFGEYWTGFSSPCDPSSPDCYRTTYFMGGRLSLTETEEFNYFDNGTVYTKSNFNYDSNLHYQKTSETTTNSLGETVQTKYYYPLDSEMSTKPEVSTLITKNMIGMPLVVESFNGTVKTSEVETVYKDWTNNVVAPEFIKTSNGALALEDRVQYTAVDPDNGNPLEVQQIGGTPITYIWGYKEAFPIAKIENATYAQVQAYEANLQSLSDANDEANLLTALDNLRNSLPNAMVTTYTYIPLVGVSTITDPKGNKVTYHYDGFNRLDYVEDKDGNKLSENEYHYKN